MKIEVSHHRDWSYLDYAEGELYCSMIIIDGKDDWRMIEYNEWLELLDIAEDTKFGNNDGWIVPVRDI
jgi:hypothetical protein